MMADQKKGKLIEKLMRYTGTDMYPFHMPGHKRQITAGNPYSVDITEIPEFDNLHHPEGILKECMEYASGVYRSDASYFLVNGSSCGILSAICAATSFGGRLLMGRNAHKSAFHGAFLNHLEISYVYPQVIPEYGIQSGIEAADIRQSLERAEKEGCLPEAVLIVSPTYDGVVTDVRAVAKEVHKKGAVLIVDEAHGAHFSFGDKEFCPESALDCGADIVIQSLHKTLPSMTQTAIMHVKSKMINRGKLERFLQIFESSSPSYILMASADSCIRYMDSDGRKALREFYTGRLQEFYRQTEDLKNICVWDRNLKGRYGIYDIDISKIILSVRNCTWNGQRADGVTLLSWLSKKHHLELEMAGNDYVLALSTLCDTEEGLARLLKAVKEADKMAEFTGKTMSDTMDTGVRCFKSALPLWEALSNPAEEIPAEEAAGRVAADYIYVYPPGIPLVVPGETVTEQILEEICESDRSHLHVIGSTTVAAGKICVLVKGD